MEKYITIKGEDLLSIMDEKGKRVLCGANKLNEDWEGYFLRGMGYIQEFNIPADKIYPKIKFTEAEKARFDKLKHICDECFGAMLMISKNDNKPLFSKLFVLEGYRKAQTDFARAWADPSLIEVIPEKKWNVKIPPFEKTDRYYYKDDGKLGWADSDDNDEEDQQFTADELKEYGLDDDMYEKVEVTDDNQ